MSKEITTIKIKMIANHPEYQKGEIYDLEEKIAVALLTNGKAIKIHRKITAPIVEKIEEKEKSEEKIIEKTEEKIDAKKLKKNDSKE